MPGIFARLASGHQGGPRPPTRAHSGRAAQPPLDRKVALTCLAITSAEVQSAAIVASAAAHAVYAFDRDQVALDDVHNPVRANPQPVIAAAVDPSAGYGSTAKPATASPMARMPS
jgi:hypothetical protein